LAKSPLYAIIDLETTGGNPRRDRITEIAILLFDGDQQVDAFTSLVNPEVGIPPEITRITGIDNDMVKDAPRFFEVARKVVEITEKAVFVAHNVRFDYGFIQQAFRRLGYTYSRRQLCTVRLARRLMPGLPSYSLGNLCRHLRIENNSAHRAWSDAAATLQLFQHLTELEHRQDFSLILQSEIAANKLPPRLDPSKVDALPEAIGVYYFYDEHGQILYIGKSNNIRKRVLSHFSGAHKSGRKMRMIQQMTDISFTLTGNELIALLHENEEIKRHQPPFNRAQRRTRLKFGIYSEQDGEGYIRFAIKALQEADESLAPYAERGHAEGALQRQVEMFSLCPKLSGLLSCRGEACLYQQIKKCGGAGAGLESPEAYNERAQAAIDHLIYGDASFLVVGEGREEAEKSVVLVENGRYGGFGFFEPELTGSSPEAIRQTVQARTETPDVRQIIRGYIRKHPKEVWVLDN
jgi:DNA polymerase-3 subunit epsilon